MSATMARKEGRVQLERSDMPLALNLTKKASGGFLRAAMEGTENLIKKPRAEVQEERKRGVQSPGHRKLKAAIERHPAMLHQNVTDGCLPCQNGTAKNRQTCWRCKGTGVPPPNWHRLPTPEPTPPLPGTPPEPLVRMTERKVPKSTICLSDICSHILHFPALNVSILMHMPRINSTIQISIRIWRLMKEHPQVSKLSAVW